MDERAISDEDYPSLWKLHVDTMGAYVGATWGWDDADQRRRFEEGWPTWRTGRVLVEGKAIAAYWRLETHADAVFLAVVEVAPGWQSRGVGSQLVLRIVSDAARLGKPTRRRVLKVNHRAARFYFKLGFTQWSEGTTHLELGSSMLRSNSARGLVSR